MIEVIIALLGVKWGNLGDTTGLEGKTRWIVTEQLKVTLTSTRSCEADVSWLIKELAH